MPDSVPIDDDEDNNLVVDTNGTFDREDWMLSHYDLVQLAGLANTVKGSVVAGSRGYFLTGMGMRLNQALISYAITHHSALSIHHPSPITHHSSLTTHHSPLTTHP